jgi:hypothetical protein
MGKWACFPRKGPFRVPDKELLDMIYYSFQVVVRKGSFIVYDLREEDQSQETASREHHEASPDTKQVHHHREHLCYYGSTPPVDQGS